MPQPQIGLWQTKIVGHARVDPATLLANPLNFRRHSKQQKQMLRSLIKDVGFVRSVTVNKRNGRIVDGHLRVELAIDDGQPLIDVEYVNLTDAEESEALATIDPIAALAEHDDRAWRQVAAQVVTTDVGLQEFFRNVVAESNPVPEEPSENLSVFAGSEYKTQTSIPKLRIGKRVVIMSHEENDAMAQALDRYVQDHNTETGFVGWLLNHVQ